MRDPHIEWLRYRITSTNVVYLNPGTRAADFPGFRVAIENELATVTMLDHFATVDDARDAVNPHLQAWEVWAAATCKGKTSPLLFQFDDYHIIDRDPAPDLALEAQVRERVVPDSVAVAESLTEYPAPPTGFQISDDVNRLWTRWGRYVRGQTSAVDLANVCLTTLEASVGDGGESRKRAAQRYGIAYAALKELGRLLACVDDPRFSRKVESWQVRRLYKDAELIWMETVAKGLILRLGEYAADPQRRFDQIDFEPFP